MTGLVAPLYCRRWTGIRCNSKNQVTELDLSALTERGLSAPQRVDLSALLRQIRRLPVLTVLNLRGNAQLLRGSTLPPWISQMSELTGLDLSDNGLTGQMPSGLAAVGGLQHLNLSANPALSGRLPVMWGALTELRKLDVSRTGATGNVPGTWAALQQLEELRLDSTNLTGALPTSLGLLGNLRVLSARNAGISGAVPDEWTDILQARAGAATALAAVRTAAGEAASVAASAVNAASTTPRGVAATVVVNERRVSARRSSASVVLAVDGAKEARASADVLAAAVAALEAALAASGQSSSGRASSAAVSSSASIGMMQLEDVDLSGNLLSGPLPIKWAMLTTLQVWLDCAALSSSLPVGH
jgi:hypothetical protein